MAAYSIFITICQNGFFLTDILRPRKHKVFSFINMRNVHKRKKSSGKFRLQKRLLYDKQLVEFVFFFFFFFFFLS